MVADLNWKPLPIFCTNCGEELDPIYYAQHKCTDKASVEEKKYSEPKETTVYVPCAEDDKEAYGTFISYDCQEVGRLKYKVGYFNTKKELEKLLSDAFDAGCDREFFKDEEHSKEQYIKNILP